MHEEGISGSPHYLAPERCAGGPATVLTDIYALGVLGFLVFTNSVPFDGQVMEIMMAHIQDAADPIGKRRGEVVDDAIEALIARAMAKQPQQRHASAGAFRYELNTVMDMLDMGRRRVKGSGVMRAENTRDVAITQSFERSRVPQALLSLDGKVVVANAAFAKLVGQDISALEGLSVADTALAEFVPGLMRAIKAVHNDAKATERRAKVYRGTDRPALELTLWLLPLPFPGQEVHLLVRVDEAEKQRDD
jgi:serine/threonine protein kinase